MSVVSDSWRTWLSVRLRPFFKPTRSELLPSWRQYFLMRPVPFEIWFRSRAAWLLLKRRWHLNGASAPSEAWPAEHFTRVVEHNFGQRWLFNRGRTEKVMNVL